MPFMNRTAGSLAALLLAAVCHAEDTPQTKTFGWRGNWTGRYPEANPPVHWKRIPSGDLAWQRFEVQKKPDYELWGTTQLEWVDPGEALGFKPNAMAYACTYLYAKREGTAVMVVDHGYGLKVWLNGAVVYERADRGHGLGSYVGISRQKQDLVHYHSPKFELALKRGWNRLLVKVSSAAAKSWREMKFTARLYDPDPGAYEEKNIAWMTKLPERSNACPLVVACYDFDGNRRWIRRLDCEEVGYTCSPALSGGKVLWTNPGKGGGWGAPLVWQGLCYAIDEYGILYCADLDTGKTLYRQETGFDEWTTRARAWYSSRARCSSRWR